MEDSTEAHTRSTGSADAAFGSRRVDARPPCAIPGPARLPVPPLAATDGGLGVPIESPDAKPLCGPRRRVPQSLRQQELVCLSSGHVSCPRYLRGSAVAVETPVPVVRAGRTVSPAILGSMLLVVMAFSASVAFVLARGGLELSAGFPDVGASPSPTTVAAVTPSPATPTPAPTPTPPVTASPTAPATPTPTPEPTPEPDRGAHGRARPDLRPLRAADRLPRRGPLLDLPGQERRQPVQHRELLRRVARQHLRPQSLGPPVRTPRGPATAAADAVATRVPDVPPAPNRNPPTAAWNITCSELGLSSGAVACGRLQPFGWHVPGSG